MINKKNEKQKVLDKEEEKWLFAIIFEWFSDTWIDMLSSNVDRYLWGDSSFYSQIYNQVKIRLQRFPTLLELMFNYCV